MVLWLTIPLKQPLVIILLYIVRNGTMGLSVVLARAFLFFWFLDFGLFFFYCCIIGKHLN